MSMGAVSLNLDGLLSSIASMYDNHLFSDVELIFITEGGVSKRLFCHSLILAIRSKKFALMFFDDLKKKTFLHKVELPSSKASSFSHLVRFLYTDDLQLHTFEEAQELYDLAIEYAVEELKEKCLNYILNEKLNIDNIFSKYEHALSKNMHKLLKECRNFVCSNSQLVLQSVDFSNASNDVVEDIVKLDNLSVLTELEIIGAVLKWGSEEMKRQKLSLDEKNLRKCIDPLMKHVRFLTLSYKEFEYLIEQYDIFSSKESSKLTQKIIDPFSDVVLPDSLSSINEKRTGKVVSNSESSDLLYRNASSSLSVNKTISPVQSLIKDDASNGIFHFSAESTLSANPLSNSFINRSLKYSTTEGFSKSSTSILTSQISSKGSTPIINSKASNISKLPTSDINKVSYQIKKISPFDENNHGKNLFDKVSSSPSLRDNPYPAPMVNGSGHLREFEFLLQESIPCFRTSFQNDVKSSITFHMITGNILLHGFEIKVENNSDKDIEELDIDVDLKGFSKQPFSELYKEKLINNVILLKFPKNMVLLAGNKGKLEVSIDNLLLKRCCTSNNSKQLELNCSNSFACEMTLNSTQKTEKGGFLFLISKLIYIPC